MPVELWLPGDDVAIRSSLNSAGVYEAITVRFGDDNQAVINQWNLCILLAGEKLGLAFSPYPVGFTFGQNKSSSVNARLRELGLVNARVWVIPQDGSQWDYDTWGEEQISIAPTALDGLVDSLQDSTKEAGSAIGTTTELLKEAADFIQKYKKWFAYGAVALLVWKGVTWARKK